MAQTTYTVPSTATYTSADGKTSQRYEQNAVVPIETAVYLQMPNATAADIVASADGTGRAVVGAPTAYDAVLSVASANANHIVTLPAPVVGGRVRLRNGATGYELRSSSPTTVAINGGTGAGAECAIAANTFVICTCDTATTWLCREVAANGDLTKTEVAAP